MNRPLITTGSKGGAVRELKVLLNHALKPSPGLTPSNDNFGPNTLKAVQKFQQVEFLKVDGKVGPNTWGALFKKTPLAIQQEASKAAQGIPATNGSATKKAVTFSHVSAPPAHREPTPAELSKLKAHQQRAQQYMAKAVKTLGNLKAQPNLVGLFGQAFLGSSSNLFAGNGTVRPEILNYASKAANNFNAMLNASKGTISYRVFESTSKSNDGKELFAFTGFDDKGHGAFIAFSKQLHLNSIEAVQMDTFLHELAHYAFRAGHAYGAAPSASAAAWEKALNGADRYALFAVMAWNE